MRINDLFEARKRVGFEERSRADAEFTDAWNKMDGWKSITPEIVAQMKNALKRLNRADSFYAGANYTRQGTYGSVYDRAVLELSKSKSRQGKVSFPTGNEPTAKSFSEHLALAFLGFNAISRNYFARTWTLGSGGKYKDAEYGIEVFSQDDFDDAWDEMKKHGVVVHVKFPLSSSPQEVVKFGKYIVYKNEKVRGVFSDSPEHEWHFNIQTTAIFKNSVTKKVDITPQEANRLNDLAATKNATALAGIKAILDHFKSKEEAKAAIDRAKGLDKLTKNVLDQVIERSKK
jgi:hypothetical protein